MNSTPWIVMRSKNDVEIISRTLEALRSQTIPFQLLNIDSGSTDGTLELIKEETDYLIQIKPEEYIPGRILNLGMQETTGEFVVFLNSDAVPTSNYWLENLLSGFHSEEIGAVYGRQISRADAYQLVNFDTERAYGDGSISATWKHFFSMANSAVRRSTWEQIPFDTELRYSEDIDWTWRLKQQEIAVQYVSEAIAEHSHNYTLYENYKRQYGEGRADADIYKIAAKEITLARTVILPVLAAWARDIVSSATQLHPASILYSLILRPIQSFGKYNGLRSKVGKGVVAL